MKIKTITCHDVYNAGASLQAYALAEYLRGLGHDVEIIDYKPEYLCHYKLWGVGNPAYKRPFWWQAYQIAKLPGRIKAKCSRKKKEFDRFTEKYLPLSSRRYASNEELKESPPEADVYFAGSDQIWNPLFKNGRDPAFYLDFAPKGSIRASYAASFATDTIPEEWKAPMARWLGKMDCISVRESSGVRILEEMGIPGAVQVLDPVFLLDASQWERMIVPFEKNDPYIFVYDFDKNPTVEAFVKKKAKENHWKIYSIFPCEYCDECFSYAGPQLFLSIVYHAQFVVSNSFHATAFSLLFRKEFVVFDRSENINARMQDLLKLFGLEDRKLSDVSNIASPIDYAKVTEKLEIYKKSAKAYIDQVLRGKK